MRRDRDEKGCLGPEAGDTPADTASKLLELAVYEGIENMYDADFEMDIDAQAPFDGGARTQIRVDGHLFAVTVEPVPADG